MKGATEYVVIMGGGRFYQGEEPQLSYGPRLFFVRDKIAVLQLWLELDQRWEEMEGMQSKAQVIDELDALLQKPASSSIPASLRYIETAGNRLDHDGRSISAQRPSRHSKRHHKSLRRKKAAV